MADYVFYVALQTTGQVMGEIELDSPRFTRSMKGGSFTASVPVAHLSLARQLDVLELTTPGKYSIIVERDGLVFGEWFIWARDRSISSPITISGNETISHLDSRLCGALGFEQVEQLQIARDFANYGFGDSAGGNGTSLGAIAINIPAPTASGRRRDRHYKLAEASYGRRLEELSQVIDGFEYDVSVKWKSVNGRRYIDRTFNLYYPRKGAERNFLFEIPASGIGGNAVDIRVAENASNYSSQSWALGQEVVAPNNSGSTFLAEGFPYRQVNKTWYSVKVQSTIESHAASLQQSAQVRELPGELTVYADGPPSVMDYDTGDSIWASVEANPVFPRGWGGAMRILSITLAPSDDPDEVAILEITPPALPGEEDTEANT